MIRPLLLLTLACGATQAPVTGRIPTAEIDPAALLQDHLERNTDFFLPPTANLEQLRAQRRDARGSERRALTGQMAVLHLYEADRADLADDARAARRHRRDAQRRAQDAMQRSRDDMLLAKMVFVQLWNAWRGSRGNARRLADRFTTRHRDSGPLLYVAWLVKGEIEAGEGNWDEAAAAYRYLLGSLDHPLYAFALLRTAHALEERDRGEEARDMYRQVVDMGCAEDLPPEVVASVHAAARELRVTIVRRPDGQQRPSTCTESTSTGVQGETELPPGFRDD